MVCIYCGSKTKVTNSRPQSRLSQTWRRRECTRCHAVFTTEEQVVYNNALRVKKRSQLTERFNNEKIYLSLLKASDHLPNAPILATNLTETVISKLLKQKPMSPIILTERISDISKSVLKAYDAAALVKYMSFQTKMPRTKDVKEHLK